MAIGVDTSKWKPRKLNGTPAGKASIVIGVGILSFGVLCGAFYQFSSVTSKYRKAVTVLYEDPIEEVERKILIASGIPIRSGDKIRKLLEEEARTDLPKTVMDESFSDFQEKKQYTTGPKITQKTKPKVVRKKPLKSRAQKDIRTFVKSKENDLVSYSKDFDKVCKKNGLDVDSEQLQLAIALSKSLQSSSDGNNSKVATSLSSQERTEKIRLTLQEYGFKIPNKNLKTDINRRRKFRKQYKLLLTSDEEKKQIILDKYSEVLATNVHKSPKKDNSKICNKETVLYHKATSIPFECIKNNETFYVKDLHFEILHDICLLRDWSNIPGRPSSPMREKNIYFKFNEINFTQEELDYILSGSLNTTQDIVKNKNIGQIQGSQSRMGVDNISICIDNMEVENVSKIINTSKNLQTKDVLEINEIPLVPKTLSVTEQIRSVSPDLFDDDLSLVYEKSSSKEASFNLKEQTVFMDLTECVADVNNDLCKTNIYMSHEENKSERKSNDFMEITECAPSSSKHSHVEEIDLTQGYISNKLKNNKTLDLNNLEKMDLTQSSNSDAEDDAEVVDSKKNQSFDETIIINDDVEHFPVSAIDISCSSKTKKNQEVIVTENVLSDNDLNLQEQPELIGNCSKATEDIIPIEHNVESSPTYNYTDHVFEHSYIYDCDNFNEDTNLDLGWSPDQNNDIENDTQGALIDVINDDNNSKGKENSKSLNKYPAMVKSDKDINFANNSIVYISKEVNIIEKESSSTNNMSDQSCNHRNITEDLENIDYDTKKMNSIYETSKDINDHESNKDYAENEHIDSNNLVNASNDIDKNNIPEGNNENLSPTDNYNDYVFEHSYIHDYYEINSPVSNENNDNDQNEIDLTQTSDENTAQTQNQNSLGKKENISIDYDEIIDLENKIDDNDLHKSISKAKESTDVSSSSKHSEVFELSDTEFNYSLHQSRFSNYDDDGFDDISKESGKRSSTKLNRSMSESDLNNRESPKRKRKSHMSQNTTPIKDLGQQLKGALTQTPASNGYIIKTRDVTPMADYAAMSSPERNEELKRYGLKPFKRKRAIQLLTYLYNQTHPVVESCDIEECASSAKKAKYNTEQVQKSPKKSPRKALKYSKSPIKSSNLIKDVEKENLLYIQTKDVPDIKEIYSEPEDWVFQAREKAKVHSCRVPLHIAFHNYVSCRKYLRESILRYEPVNIDVIHKELVSIGYRYNPKDLLKFMDKKCITVKTVDNNARNRK
ncbi:unnamed protein product, partial [Brenthis ino]